MTQIPDAPWIRDAEINGMPDGDDVYCPVCGAENPETIYLQGGEILGCDECVKRVDGYDYLFDLKQRSGD